MDNLKKVYLNIKLSDKEIEQTWQDLEKVLTHSRRPLLWLKYSFASLSLVVLFLTGLVSLAQAAGPATTLYPVKILSDKITGKILNKPEISVEKRAQDLIKASEPGKIEEAAKQYSKALDDAEKEVKKSEAKKKNLSKTLEKQEELFKKEINKNSKLEEKLKEVLEKTENTRKKIKD